MSRQYRLPLRVLAAAVLSWALLAVARPALHAGTGCRRSTTPNGKIVRSGFITVGQPGLYNFGMTADEISRLFIDNESIIDHGSHRPDAPRTGSVPLTRGISPRPPGIRRARRPAARVVLGA